MRVTWAGIRRTHGEAPDAKEAAVTEVAAAMVAPLGDRLLDVLDRVLVGRPMRSDRLGKTLLLKKLALPVRCSDPLSSVAYATEQIVLGFVAAAISCSPSALSRVNAEDVPWMHQ